MAVAANDHLGSRSDRTLQNPVVSWVSFDRLYVVRRLDEAGDNTQLPVGFGQPFWRAFELVLKTRRASAMMASETARST